MSKKPEGTQKPRQDREARLVEQLRANLQRRKAQARSRREGEADRRPAGISASEPRDGDGD